MEKRILEVPLHDKTIQDLIAAHLQAMCLIKSEVEVTNLTIGEIRADGTRAIKFNLELDIQTI